jgi:hypothetical protein
LANRVMELTTLDKISSAEEAGRFRDQSEDVISSSSPVDRNAKNRRTQQVICTGAAPGILSSASGAFMMTQDKDNVFRLFDALSQEVLWMCDSRKELVLKAYSPMSNKIVALVTVGGPETAKGYQLALWDLSMGNVLLLTKVTQILIVHCFNHGGTRIIVSKGSEHFMMLDMDSGSELFRFQLNLIYAQIACCFTHDDSKVAIVSHPLSGTNFAVDIWEVAPRLGLQMFSRNVKSPGLIRKVTSSFNSQMIAIAAGGNIVIMDLSSANHSLLSETSEPWYRICFGCDDSCIVALSLDGGSKSLGVYRIADSVALFRIPLRFCIAVFGGTLFASASKIYLTVLDGDLRSIVYVFDYTTGAKLQQSSVYDYPIAQLFVREPVMILM